MTFSSFSRGASFAAVALAVCALTPAALQAQSGAAPVEAPPAAAAGADPTFPASNPADFTAASPTKAQVMAFLNASWGYDTTRMFQVQAIQTTAVAGLSKVYVLVGEKGNAQSGGLQFFVLPDSKHIITSDEILPFGDRPFAENRQTLVKRADGPYVGAESKDLELVEFADLQCPHCKEAQATMDKLVADYPKAHIVFQSFPLVTIHPQAFRSAAYGACVAKMAGNAAYLKYANAVYDGQDGLATPEGATLTLSSAVTKAGLDPAKVEACSTTAETKASVNASIKLATDLNVNQTPELAINGRVIPFGGIDYELLKKIIDFEVKNDGPAN